MKKNYQKNVLIIDIGNSYSKIAVAKHNLIYKKKIIKNENKIDFEKIYTVIKTYKNNLFHGSIIGSVNPKLTKIFYEIVKEILGIEAYLINKKTKINFCLPEIPIKKIGQDILALSEYCVKKNKNAVGFCFGTAIFGILIKNKKLIGSSISIGLKKNLEALNLNTKLIEKVETKKINKIYWGTDTKSALLSGLYHYALGFMNSFYKVSKNYLKNKKIYSVVSGGEIIKIKTDFNYELNNNAILMGYSLIYWNNQN